MSIHICLPKAPEGFSTVLLPPAPQETSISREDAQRIYKEVVGSRAATLITDPESQSNELRDAHALGIFNRPYTKLTAREQDVINRTILTYEHEKTATRLLTHGAVTVIADLEKPNSIVNVIVNLIVRTEDQAYGFQLARILGEHPNWIHLFLEFVVRHEAQHALTSFDVPSWKTEARSKGEARSDARGALMGLKVAIGRNDEGDYRAFLKKLVEWRSSSSNALDRAGGRAISAVLRRETEEIRGADDSKLTELVEWAVTEAHRGR